MHRISVVIIFLIAGVAALFAGTPQVDVAACHDRSASNHFAYPDTLLPALTPAPDGFEPFFINHYGRHGSRWLTKQASYDRPLQALQFASRNGWLTPRGERLLQEVATIQAESQKRAGDLSDVGAEQHQRIAARMVKNFPEVFAGDARIDARSTVILRCILSMLNETMTLRSINPQLRITTDASKHDMHYMGWGYGEDTLANHIRYEVRTISDSLNRLHIMPQRFMQQVFNTAVPSDSINAQSFMADIFALAGSLQNHHAFDGMSLYDLFTEDELFELWRLTNIYWYLQWANAPQNGNRMPFIERALLREMIAAADRAIASPEHGAALRFGHETCVLPLACLLELSNVNYACHDIEDLHNHWQNYDIFPMACNIQMIFYRKAGGERDKALGYDDILVKVLLNEREVTLPFATDSFPYYHWSDLRPYYLQKLTTPIDWRKCAIDRHIEK